MPAGRDAAIAAVAAGQNRLITTSQLEAIKVSEGAIRSRVREHRLFRVAHGLYLVGTGQLDTLSLRRAGLLLAGPGSFLADKTAAEVEPRTLLRPSRGMVTVCRPGRGRQVSVRTMVELDTGGHGLITIRRAMARPEEIEQVDGFATTSVPRTLLDIAGRYPALLPRAWNEAEYGGHLDHDAMARLLATTKREGAPLIRKLLVDALEIEGVPESPAEFEAIKAVIRAGAPEPLVNVPYFVGGRWRRPDLFWPLAMLIVEIDGWQGHRTRRSFEDDPQRDSDFLEAGILTLRYTARRTKREPGRVAELILHQIAERSAGRTHPGK